MPLDLSVIITTYNSAPELKRALDSIGALDTAEQPRETFVVDNASSDDSAATAGGYPWVTLIRSPGNLGLAAANNLGAGRATCRSMLFLNPDTTVIPGALGTLMQFENEHPRAALLGPAMLDHCGGLHSTARTWPSLLDVVLRRTFLGRLPGASGRLNRHLYPVGAREPSVVDWIVGAAIWLTESGRRSVGLMSDRYFLYFEDVQWCMRAFRAGMEVWYVPDSVIVHEGRRESAGRPGRALWLHLVSMVRFFCEYPCAAVGRCRRTGGDDRY